jgi:hypothetical protein
MSKWLQFEKGIRLLGRTTDMYRVTNKEYGTFLGMIKWYGPFRQYSFFPEANMVFEKTCMQDITDFMKNLMEERKKNKVTAGL